MNLGGSENVKVAGNHHQREGMEQKHVLILDSVDVHGRTLFGQSNSNFINPQVSRKKKTSVKTLFCNVPNQLKVAEGAGGAGGACNKQFPPFSYP